MIVIFERPRPVMDTPQTATLVAVLDCADRARVFVLEEVLPLVVEVTGEDVLGVEVCEGDCCDD
jgi:hypothetical protein